VTLLRKNIVKKVRYFPTPPPCSADLKLVAIGGRVRSRKGEGRMRTIIAMAALLAASVANAAPLNFACDGATTVINEGRDIEEVERLTVDLSAMSVTLEHYGSAPITEIKEDRIWFDQGESLLWAGFINRISGAIHAMVLTTTQGMYVFDGTCTRLAF
jgi:hypothetical protein